MVKKRHCVSAILMAHAGRQFLIRSKCSHGIDGGSTTSVGLYPGTALADYSSSGGGHRCSQSYVVNYDLRVQFAQLLTHRAGSEIDMSVLNRKPDYFDTLQVPCSDPGFFRETQ